MMGILSPKHYFFLLFLRFLRFLLFVFVLFVLFFLFCGKFISTLQHVCTVLTILQNHYQFRIPDCQTVSTTSVERSFIHFFFINLRNFLTTFSFAFRFSFNNHEVDLMWHFAGRCRPSSICKRYECVYSSFFSSQFSFQSHRSDIGTKNSWQ